MRRLVFLDESGANLAMGRSHAWVPRGSVLVEPRPRNWGDNLTLVGAMRVDRWLTLSTAWGAMTTPRFTASLDVIDDPTLRRGDIVVTREGPMVYAGNDRGRGREQALVHPDDFKGLPQSVRNELAGLRVAKDATATASLPASATPAEGTVKSISYMPRLAPVEVTPVAEAFSSFVR